MTSVSMPWLVTAGLLAYVVWINSRRGAVEFPSLSPSKPAPAAPPPAATGTSPLLLAAILAPWGLLAWTQLTRPETNPDVVPPPAPAPDGWPSLDLRGAFLGPTAVDDALTTQFLSESLAGWVAYDGTLPSPLLTTGAEFAALRKHARDGRLAGVTLGSRQPQARDRIKAFLDAAVGDKSGPVDDTFRPKFVRAMNDIARAAAVAVGRKP